MEYHWYEDYWAMPRNLPKGHQFFIGYYQTQRANDSVWRISTRISRCFCLHGCWIMDIVYFFISRVELSPS